MDVDEGERGAGEALRRKDMENAIRGIHAENVLFTLYLRSSLSGFVSDDKGGEGVRR
jgi:hypothetical protein